MKNLSTQEIRQAFVDYFKSQNHHEVHSAPVVPGNDPTLLFTNAGMVQFKDVFLGNEQRPYSRATTVQRCIRAGGKHNDLENVGYTARHHTFFEMLGNFSFGDYFKEDAIRYAWEFLTQVLQIPPEKLWVTVFEEDQEAEDIWFNKIGISRERFSRCGAKDNFWQMGDTGPCGPCSEIFYDHGAQVAGGPPGSADADGDRWIEIWNLVFMQFDRAADGTLTPLPKPSVDTGMGLERLAAVLQNEHNNYDIDLFKHLTKAVAQAVGILDTSLASVRVIADHIRSCSFMIVDGVLPSNEGRGYVLRRIIRRALRHGHKLGQDQVFFHKLVNPLVEVMGDAYPELKTKAKQVEEALLKEEQRFAETLHQGMQILQDIIPTLSNQVIPGDIVFKLYDTYGFPLDLTADVAREQGLTLDEAGFEDAMNAQRDRARAASHFAMDTSLDVSSLPATEFLGYGQDATENLEVLALFNGQNHSVSQLQEGEEGIVVLNKTPFYGESGGQVGDSGSLTTKMHAFHVDATQKQGGVFLHKGKMTAGSLSLGEKVTGQIHIDNRRATERNHSATHLLHKALREVLGTHVEQKGSLVDQSKLRFDFSHGEPVKPEQIKAIENLVRQAILANAPVATEEMGIESAKARGAMALFGEKYGDVVRVVDMGEYSIELCGGTHVPSTGSIGPFKITSETGVASGIRRIEAVTGNQAWLVLEAQQEKLLTIASITKAQPDLVVNRVEALVEQIKTQEKTIKDLKQKLASGQTAEFNVEEVCGIKLLVSAIEGADSALLRETLDQQKNKLGSAIILLAAAEGDKVSLAAGVTPDLTQRIKAGDLVNFVALQVDGKGGGRPDMAMAGGKNPAALPGALASVKAWVESQLG